MAPRKTSSGRSDVRNYEVAPATCNVIALDCELQALIEAEALAEAETVRARRRVELHILALSKKPATDSAPAEHMTRAQYARSRNVSAATVSRWIAEDMPVLPVGSTVRIDARAADEWRLARGRRPTVAPGRDAARAEDTADVSSALSRAGLRVVGGGGK